MERPGKSTDPPWESEGAKSFAKNKRMLYQDYSTGAPQNGVVLCLGFKFGVCVLFIAFMLQYNKTNQFKK